MKSGLIRPLVICVFRHKGRILVQQGFDPATGEEFFRPLGGAIEFGETSRAALIREMREEIQAEITHLDWIGTLENIFTYDDQPGHEIVLVYDAAFVDRTLYDREPLTGMDDGKLPIAAVWKRVELFAAADAPPLYPDGLVELLMEINQSDE